MNNGTFSNRDIELAGRSLMIYTTDVLWAIREFDDIPSSMIDITRRAKKHNRKSSEFLRRLTAIQEFVRTLQHFVNRPVFTSERKVITSQHVRTFTLMNSALTLYLTAIQKHGPTSIEVKRCAYEVAYTINPDNWRRVGSPVPKDCANHRALGTAACLKAIADLPKAR